MSDESDEPAPGLDLAALDALGGGEEPAPGLDAAAFDALGDGAEASLDPGGLDPGALDALADEGAPGLDLSALERALSWADCLESHAARVFASAALAESDAVHTLLKKLCDGTAGLPEEFKARDVRNKCWGGLTRPQDAEAACELLADHRWLIPTHQPTGTQGGRPTTTYHLNPQAETAFRALG